MTGSTPEIMLSTHNLSVGYKTHHEENVLFERLNLSLPAHQLICFMGSNGIGKSTLIRTLAGLQKPLSGSVHLKNNKYVDSLSQKIAVVLTDRISALNLTVKELIAYGRYPYLNWNINLTRQDKDIIEQSIQRVHLDHLIHKRLFELSDGQLQMVMIARALAQNSEIIILDEPTAHLDLNNRVEMMNLLRQLAHHQKKTILLATHELDLALQTADLVWLAGKNKGMLTGLPEDLVLDGSFDEIFQFKGFDLKTGKMHQEAYRNTTVRLTGSGYELLWTKNALERNGFRISDSSPIAHIEIGSRDGKTFWTVQQQGALSTAHTLAQLINSL